MTIFEDITEGVFFAKKKVPANQPALQVKTIQKFELKR